MGRERLPQRERRAAYQKLKSGNCERRSATVEEQATVFHKINRNEHQQFGVRRLIDLKVDDLHPLPQYWHLEGVYLDSHVTWLTYAAWRRRDIIVRQLLVAGASPTVRADAPDGLLSYAKDGSAGHDSLVREMLLKMPASVQVYVVEQVVYLRSAAIRAAVAGEPEPCCQLCSRVGFSLRIVPCGCICCEACVWLHFCSSPSPNDLCCPSCDATVAALPEEAHTIEPRNSRFPDDSRCQYCGYKNSQRHPACPNCGVEKERREDSGSCKMREVCSELPTVSKKMSQQNSFHAAPLREVVYSMVSRLDDDQRKERLMLAATTGNTAIISAVASLGWSIDEPLDVYGQTTLFAAVANNQVHVVDQLLELRANPNTCVYGGSTPAAAAASHGHSHVLRLLAEADADLNACGSQRKPPLHYFLSRGLRNILPLLSFAQGSSHGHKKDCEHILLPRITRLIDGESHLGAGSCFIDGALSDTFLEALDHLYTTLPVAARERCTQGMNDRSYVLDAEGWISEALCDAVRIFKGNVPCGGKAMPFMRFLTYSEAGGGLPPHQDLSRTMNGITSTCTFVLYITECDTGGETVLLDTLQLPCNVLASIQPRRGRLLIFPHKCPHMAKAVDGLHLPKILLRGEMY